MRGLLDTERLYGTPEEMRDIDPARLVERFSFVGNRDRRILITPTATRYHDGGLPIVFTAGDTLRGVLPLLQDRLIIRSNGLGDSAELLVVDRQAIPDESGVLRKYDITGLGTIDELVVPTWEHEHDLGESMVLRVDNPLGWVKVIDPGVVLAPHPRVEELVMEYLDGDQAAEFATASKVVWAVMSYHNQQLGTEHLS